MTFRHIAKFSILLAIPAMVTAQAAPQQCLTRAEMRSGISYVMPMLFGAVKNACATALPKGSFLSDGSGDMINKYQALADENKPAAFALLGKFGGSFGSGMKLDSPDGTKDMNAEQAEMLSALLPIMLEEGLAKEIKPESCGAMNEIMESLAPLPPENMAKLIESIAVEVIRSEEANKAKNKSKKKGASAAASLLCS
jgi:hypothetical protein